MQFVATDEASYISLFQYILKYYPKSRVFFLIGELGSGKTTFTKYFIKFLGSIEEAQSPTFILHREYGLPEGLKANHIDLYRLDSDLELAELRLEKLENTSDFVLIEWADKYEDILKDIFQYQTIIKLEFSHTDNENVREISLSVIDKQ